MQPNTPSAAPVPLDPDDDALPESESMLSRREVRISLGVIGALLIVLGVLVARRWSADKSPVAKPPAGSKEAVAETTAPSTSETAAALTPPGAEELPPVALRPVEDTEPPFDEPAVAQPETASDPFSQQFAASATQDAAQEVGQATLAPEETATDDGFPNAAETGIASEPLMAEPDAFGAPPSSSEDAPPTPTAFDTAATPTFPEEPAGPSPFESSDPALTHDASPLDASAPLEESGTPPLDSAADDLSDPPQAFADESARSNPLRPAAPPEVSAPRDDIPPAVPQRAAEQPEFGTPPAEALADSEPPFDSAPPAHTDPPSESIPDVEPQSAPLTQPMSSAPVGQPPSASTAEPYRTVTGDTFWSISKRAYGTGAYYQALAEFNRGIVPAGQSPAAGQSLLIPTAHELEQRFPQLCPTVAAIRQPGGGAAIPTPQVDGSQGAAPAMTPSAAPTASPISGAALPSAQVLPRGQRAYRVKPGESLYDIAEQQLGSPLRWTDIYKLNKQQLGDRPHDLRAGMDLILPSPEDRSAANPRIRP